jgi:hypothetical protein
MESVTSGESKRLVVAALFAFCVAPTFISYQPYLFDWDDADYLLRSIAVSRAFWSGNVHGLGAMVSIRPPAMTLLGLPWGPLASWDAAGKCFITLAAVISLLAASCLYLLLRIGVKRFFLVVASVCVGASIGPYPHAATTGFGADRHGAVNEFLTHGAATGFLADSLFAWTTLAAVLLIPYEARTPCLSIRGAVVRGILWGSILSLGVMTKLNFFYFIVFIVPTLFLITLHHGGLRLYWRRSPRKGTSLFLIRLHHGGLRRALAALIAFACASAPSAVYLVRWGRPAFHNLKASSFGGVADFYYVPLLQFLGNTIRESPGLVLSFVLTAAALIYLVIKRRLMQSWPDFLALLIMIGFGIVVLAATNRQIRYAFPAIVALPFLAGILMSGKGHSAPGPSAALAAGLVFCGLLAAGVPTRHRANRQSLSRSDAVLAQAVRCNAKRIVLATDSPTLNANLMALAIEFSASGASAGTLAYRAMSGVPIKEDFRAMSEADQVVFQDGDALSPAFTNQRASEYERYIRQGGSVPIRVGG